MDTKVRRPRSPLFARPNLGAFILMGLALLLVQEVVLWIEPDDEPAHVVYPARRMTSRELLQLFEQAENHPTEETFRQLSVYYEGRRDLRRALHYQRKADLLAQANADMD